MATNKLGPGTVNIGINVPKELRAQLEKLAAQSGKKLSAYVRDILDESVQSGVVYEQVKTYSTISPEAALSSKSTAAQPPRRARVAGPTPPVPDAGKSA